MTRPPARALLAFAAFVVPSALAALAGVEYWPFSHYPMYSRAKESAAPAVFYRLYGESVDGVEREIESVDELFPLHRGYLSGRVAAFVGAGAAAPLDDLMGYYRRRLDGLERRAGRQPFRCLRLARVEYPRGRRAAEPARRVETVREDCR